MSTVSFGRPAPGVQPRASSAGVTGPELIARLERLPVTRTLLVARIVVGSATFFDAYTSLAIAFAMPSLLREWSLSPAEVGFIISSGYAGQFVGALFFGWLAERVGRLRVLTITIVLFAAMSLGCLFAWSAASMIVLRFLQGIGTGGEMPVASAYVNEFVGAKQRGRFFMFYEALFPIGLLATGIIGYYLVPEFGWRAMFVVGIVPILLTVPFRFLMPESPRWLIHKRRFEEADAVIRSLEENAVRHGQPLPEPARVVAAVETAGEKVGWTSLFQGIYTSRTVMLWGLWFCVFMIMNGLITWLPTLYRETYKLPLDTSIFYGFITNAAGVAACLVCAVLIDKVGRRPWYIAAFCFATLSLVALPLMGVGSALTVVLFASLAYGALQTLAMINYLYNAELYPTRMRALGLGLGTAWLRIGSTVGPLMVAWTMQHGGIAWVFSAFAVVAAFGAMVSILFVVETKGAVLEKLSP